MSFNSGRHFLQLPGPTNVPERVLRAMHRPTIDHRSAEFGVMTTQLLGDLQRVFGMPEHVFVFPGSATGAWEAAIANTLSAGDRVLMFDRGFFATNWKKVAERFGLLVDFVEGPWESGPTPEEVSERLRQDGDRAIKAVMVVHNETSTGVRSRIPEIRQAIDAVDHPALLMVDAVSSLGSMEFLHRDWGVDVTVAGSQKGLMLPPGLSFNAVSRKALGAATSATLPVSYWRWDEMQTYNAKGFFPFTPATNLLYGLVEAVSMLFEEGLSNVFVRHARHAEATRRAVRAWGLDFFAVRSDEWSDTVTTVRMPDGHDADALRDTILSNLDMSLGTGLGKLKGQVFRVGHLGHFNDLMLMGTLCGIEMGMRLCNVPFRSGGVDAAMTYLTSNP